MRALRILPLFWVFGLSACNCGGTETPDAHPDAAAPVCAPACGTGQVCDPATLTCKKALSAGAACGSEPDGGVVEGACAEGLSCGEVGSLKRCSQDCTSTNSATVCGAIKKCFARPNSTGTSGYCGVPSPEGQPCDDAQLIKCSGDNLLCLNPVGQTLGQCFHLCDPTNADPNPECAPTASCADLFPSDPKTGVCAVPAGRYPKKCDYSTMTFCARHEVCVRPSAESFGYCHQKCAKPADCAAPEQCTYPTTGLGICAQTLARCVGSDTSKCTVCDAMLDTWCGPDDLCVGVGKANVCKQDCTTNKACAAGVCTALSGTDRSVCLD